jgi:hypothetical protein
MVVSEHIPGVVVEVKVAGEALKEHVDTDAEEKRRTTSRYIEITSGAVFTISIALNEDFVFKGDTLLVWIRAGGKNVDFRKFHEDRSRRSWVSKGPASIGKGLKYRFEHFEKGTLFAMI